MKRFAYLLAALALSSAAACGSPAASASSTASPSPSASSTPLSPAQQAFVVDIHAAALPELSPANDNEIAAMSTFVCSLIAADSTKLEAASAVGEMGLSGEAAGTIVGYSLKDVCPE